MATLGFGTCGAECPWRGGANENTVFAVSHDVEIEGKTLPAGRYGLHFIPGAEAWTLIFSKNSTAWGSFFYDAKEDQLRVTVTPAKAEYSEFLTYEFIDRQPDRATVALRWERLQVPWSIRVPDVTTLWLDAIRRDMRNAPGFSWLHQQAAAQFCLQNKVNLEEALGWARQAANPQVGGQENFTTLMTVAGLLEATGKAADGAAMVERALNHPASDAIALHQYGRQLVAQKRAADALKVFETNARRFNGAWPTQVGLMRGYAALGRTKEALDAARKALAQAPDDLNRRNLENLIARLEAGQPIG
jgi:tetratricopeptide (TPR) repeat protein